MWEAEKQALDREPMVRTKHESDNILPPTFFDGDNKGQDYGRHIN